MFDLIYVLILGFIVGLIARKFHPGEEKGGLLFTLIVGLVGMTGSFIGGLLNYLLLGGNHLFGFITSIIVGVIFCRIYSKWESK